ncbi:TRAP transporter substrate-binding protein [Croceicoccus ponticola]|uniref:TRAP transporter substrate-binding protein n=1 Tax=Croceicoccus ponticola TaxID=2217664 RepID=A0A437H2D4_9SPHN|nr:TRAP transporter substrate-binding protein [Croceicoccus ponticola]RVQ69729.1 TRAP transporter substrate-binding protein [Croceicoccus ponticola]
MAGSGFSRRKLLAGSIALSASMLAGCERRMSGLLTSADAHPGDYPTVQAVEFIGRYLSDRTGGRLGVKVYAGGQLGSETDTLEIASFGGLDLTRVNFAPLNSIEPMTLPFSLPFLFQSVDHMRKVVDSPLGDEVLASLESHDLIGLAIYDSGARSFYNTRGPIRSPADMKGLKLRVPQSDLYVAMVNALGANAVPIPLNEVYQALQQGVIDGAENNWPSFVTARHYEVAKYYSLTHHLLTPEALVMSKQRYTRLSPSDRTLVREAARASVPFMRQKWDAKVDQAKRDFASSPGEVNTVDTAPFAALMRPVWEAFITSPRQRAVVERTIAMGEA